MINTKKVIVFLTLISCFFILISTASATDYYVNQDTPQKNIVNWMKNDAKNGDSLIFNTTNYTLTDTLAISKSITIKSDVNTKISFNKNKDMFNVQTNGITFSGLNLDYNGQGKYEKGKSEIYGAVSALNASKQTNKKFFVKDTIINVNKKYTSGILLGTLQGNIINSTINIKGTNCSGISLTKWTGNIINSTINIKGANCFGISLTKWTGNIINSTIKSTGKDSISVYSITWSGTVNKSKIHNNGSYKNILTAGFIAVNSKGSIINSEIKSKNSYAVRVSDNVKLTNSSLSSKKGLPTVYRFRPDLAIYNQINISKNTYSFRINNIGQISSKACTFVLKTGKITKKATVKALKPNKYVTVKIKLPSKYMGKKYLKNVQVDFYKVNKENDRKNNVGKFKF